MTVENLVTLVNQVGSSNALVNAYLILKSYGFFTVVPSVLLTLAVIYGILEKLNFPEQKKLRGLVTLFLAFALFIFANALEFVVGYITDLYSLVFYLMTAYLGILILGGLILGEKARQGSAWIPSISLLAVFVIGLYYLRFQSRIAEAKEATGLINIIFSYLSDPAILTTLAILVLFIAIVWWLSLPEEKQPKEKKKSITERVLDLLREEIEREIDKEK